MLTLEPKEIMYDRNGLRLVYGNEVLACCCPSYKFTKCQVIGFTNKYVVIIPTNGSTIFFMRKPTNVIKVNNLSTLKFNY